MNTAVSTLRFISDNKFKIREAGEILNPFGISLIPKKLKIDELQSTSMETIIRHKALTAFTETGRPLLVEHTGLELDSLNGFPGGLTRIFWDSVVPSPDKAENFTTLFGTGLNVGAIARSVIAYCDGKEIQIFEGHINGKISSEPRGPRDFQWDCVFIPDGFSETFAEMGNKKNTISMRKIAMNSFASYLCKGLK